MKTETKNGTGGPDPAPRHPSLAVGYVVEICSKHDPEYRSHGHVGQIQAIDDRGIRITHLDWVVGTFAGFDRFVPWDQILEISIATPDHDEGLFLESIASASRSRRDKRPGVSKSIGRA